MLLRKKNYSCLIGGDVSAEKIKDWSLLFREDDHKIWFERDKADGQALNTAEKSQSEDGENIGNNSAESGYNSSGEASAAARKALEDEWKNTAEKIQMDLESFSKKHGDMAGELMQNLMAVNREKYDYTNFLKKFTVMGEAMKINDDEFDYIFYTYGMKMYGNMPLIEPLEYKEVKWIKEFVIAIDTSGSV